MDRRTFIGASAAAAAALQIEPASAVGQSNKFSAPVQTEWLPDGRKMRLLRALTYWDPRGKVWTAPAGWKIDGASIPRCCWSIAGGPFEGRYRDASVIHDYYCDTKTETWEATHQVFQDGMVTSGASSLDVVTKYFAVYKFGPRWDAMYEWDGFLATRKRLRGSLEFSLIAGDKDMSQYSEMIEPIGGGGPVMAPDKETIDASAAAQAEYDRFKLYAANNPDIRPEDVPALTKDGAF